MSSPLLSVIISAYNSGNFIQETIYSVINQTFEDWELIVVDDCSSDDTYKEVTDVQDRRIRIIRRDKNSGLPAVSRNIGIRVSRGEFIAFLDHDDVWFPDKLDIQLRYLRDNTNVSLICSPLRIKSTDRRYNSTSTINRGETQCGYMYNQLLNSNFAACSSVIVKASALDDVGYFDESPEIVAAEDWDLWLRIARKYKILFIPRALGIYRVHNFNISMDNKRLLRALYVIDKHFKKGWITQEQADRARVNFYFREGWFFVDRNIRMSRSLFYNALHSSKGNPRMYCVSVLGLFLSIFPFLCNFIKKKSLDRKIGSRIFNPQNL